MLQRNKTTKIQVENAGPQLRVINLSHILLSSLVRPRWFYFMNCRHHAGKEFCLDGPGATSRKLVLKCYPDVTKELSLM